ncbi:type I-E CRISPR-associated protein Cas5/CasD [bacterium]|nr:type I-E CRISPR-associated protein Cas5/CasD [bacterium]
MTSNGSRNCDSAAERRYLILRLEAPLMSFGGVMVDGRGVEMALPAKSLITGLLANALGYRREQTDRLQALQDRLYFAVQVDRTGTPMRDFQTAQLGANDTAWTTRGVAEGRAGGAATYDSPYIRERDYHADRSCAVAIWLDPPEQAPSLEALSSALENPARPLFIGRKPCLPSEYLSRGVRVAANPQDALASHWLEDAHNADYFEQVDGRAHTLSDFQVSGERLWRHQIHAGQQRWRRHHIVRPGIAVSSAGGST